MVSMNRVMSKGIKLFSFVSLIFIVIVILYILTFLFMIGEFDQSNQGRFEWDIGFIETISLLDTGCLLKKYLGDSNRWCAELSETDISNGSPTWSQGFKINKNQLFKE
jgi:hypothetical protein